jgi:hypothetical protein
MMKAVLKQLEALDIDEKSIVKEEM